LPLKMVGIVPCSLSVIVRAAGAAGAAGAAAAS